MSGGPMRRNALHSSWFLIGLFSFSCSSLSETLPSFPIGEIFPLEVKAGEWERTAYVYVPKGYGANRKPSLVLAFHGAGGNGSMMLSRYGWKTLADKAGFIVVAPEGLPALPRQPASFLSNPRVWRSGDQRRRAARFAVDDVEFTRVLLDELKKRVPYDEGNVFSTGHSNGGGMTFKLGAELSERFAAIAMVAGTMELDNPKPKKPLPTLYILGTLDPLVPLEGGEVKLPWFTRQNPPVAEFLEKWAAAIGCQTMPRIVSDKEGVRRLEYPAGTGEAKLNVMYIEGHGHHWPGAGRSLPANLIGPITKKIDATETIWEFFEKQNEKQD